MPDALQDMIAKLESLGNIAQEVAPLVAKELERDVKAQAAAGNAPDGTPWELKKDGGKALPTAGSHVKSSIHGTVVMLKITGHMARHHYGIAKGGIKRQILPTFRTSETAERAITRVIQRHIAEKLEA